MIQNNTYETKFNQRPEYVAGRSHQNQFHQNRSYENQPSYQNQVRTPIAYNMHNPQINHSVSISALAALPVELGGEMPGNRSQFSGAQNW